MKLNKDKWIASVKRAADDKKIGSKGATSGKVCAIASLRYIRDNLIDDIYGAEVSEEDAGAVDAIKESFLELIQAIAKDGVDYGFASNASASAKAAGFKAENVVDTGDAPTD